MKIPVEWQFNEMAQVGKDYADIVEVQQYDARHSKFRDVEQENNDILETLAVRPEHVIADFGAGTGAFCIQAAGRCRKVYAIDVSKAMLEYAAVKARGKGLLNIEYCHGGFLSYAHGDDPVDMVVTKLALHHLPDFWKGVALQNINRMLKRGGRLFLFDVIFSEADYLKAIARWLAGMQEVGGKQLGGEIEQHLREEFSTFSWIMAGLIEKAGFTIDNCDYQQGVLARYLCTKK